MKKINIRKTNMEVNLRFLRSLKFEWKKTAKRIRQNKDLDELTIHNLYDCLGEFSEDIREKVNFSKGKNIVDTLALLSTEKKKKEKIPKISFEVDSSDEEKNLSDSDPEINELKKELALLTTMTRKIKKKFTRFRNPGTNNKQRTSSSNYSDKASRPSDKAVSGDSMKCFKCGKLGHFAKECHSAKKEDFNYYMQKVQMAKQMEQ
ncbi:unnamed protein product [Cuscuta europaea]|uniref:CCHC-type domain-containing protein n=1 Tax=Cuscuta europaea TaxID=41803 RepID=A0A9P0Z9D2_CUSEU|nr:unnamed protein product [Cuscuta europaea]